MNFDDKLYNFRRCHLSIARHYGGINIQGVRYIVDDTDPRTPLIRAGTPTYAQEQGNDKSAKDKADIARSVAAQKVLI